ncbi:MAG: ferredoxin family protein [Cuniculiplasma divulgatum]|jgi:NAD-dependent dihydropyrimidine dehydrogenase PreA subunit|nr:MAG: ferredoxin family protein [Cuniculiplasma divulgatum]
MSGDGTWHGVERRLVEWYPIVDAQKCDGCGMCLLTCGNDVYRWDLHASKPVVVNPGKCVIGCTTCGKLCDRDAIAFPEDPKKFVRNVVIKYKIFPRVKEDLAARLEKFPEHSVHLEEDVINDKQ